MQVSSLRVLICCVLCAAVAASIAGCGGGATSNGGMGAGGGNLPPSNSTITITFTDGTPLAVATQIGNGPFTAASLQNNTLTLPAGTTKYAVAYVCPTMFSLGSGFEFVIEATVQDGSAYSVSCMAPPAFITGTFQVDASAFPTTRVVTLFGKDDGFGGITFPSGSLSGAVTYQMVAGMNDIVLLTADTNTTAAKILRSQPIPNAVNGGNPVVFTASDAVTTQPITLTNIPAGFNDPGTTTVSYVTANNTQLGLACCGQMLYTVLPPAEALPADFYRFDFSYVNPQISGNQAVSITHSATSVGAVMLSLPTPWTYSGPAAASFPTFSFNYSGFAAVAEYAQIQWPISSLGVHGPHTTISVTATASFQNGVNTITIPDLSSVPGFSAPAPSGTTITWVADIFGGTPIQFPIVPSVEPNLVAVQMLNVPPNGSTAYVQTEGTYTQP